MADVPNIDVAVAAPPAAANNIVNIDFVKSAHDRALLLNAAARSTEGHLVHIRAIDCAEDNGATSKLLQNKVLKVVLLSIKSGNSTKLNQANQGMYGGANKKQRTNLVNYDRMAIFGDLMDKPNIFMTFLHNCRLSSKVFHSSRSMCVVGAPYYIYEPQKYDDKLRDIVPLLPLKPGSLMPLKLDVENHLLSQLLPPHPIQQPTFSRTHFFVLHNVPIEISLFQVCVDDCCSGIFCDRTLLLSTSQKCACYETTVKTSKSIVSEFSVALEGLPPTSTPSGNGNLEIDDFRSYRTSLLFFENLSHYSSQATEVISLRKPHDRVNVAAIVGYINDNGGWTMVGWSKIGEIEDVSNPTGEHIESAVPTYHISLLLPSNLLLRNATDDGFRALRIPTATPPELLAQQPAPINGVADDG